MYCVSVYLIQKFPSQVGHHSSLLNRGPCANGYKLAMATKHKQFQVNMSFAASLFCFTGLQEYPSLAVVARLFLHNYSPANKHMEIHGPWENDLQALAFSYFFINVNPGLINPVYGWLIGGVPFKYWLMTIGGVPLLINKHQ